MRPYLTTDKRVQIVLYASSVTGAASHQSQSVTVLLGDQRPLCEAVEPIMAAVGQALGELRKLERKRDNKGHAVCAAAVVRVRKPPRPSRAD